MIFEIISYAFGLVVSGVLGWAFGRWALRVRVSQYNELLVATGRLPTGHDYRQIIGIILD
jgi:hypothetical protein